MLLYLPHFNLQSYNTLASPVCADFFVSVSTEAELLASLKYAREHSLPILVLGGGSNIILCDDFPGLAIKINLKGRVLVSETEEHFFVKAAAGENWQEFVEYCLDNHYWGLENLSLIPGSVGAAPIQNIGAYGVELQDVFAELNAIDIFSGLSVTFTHDSCQFGYRDSIFKGALKDNYISTSVTFRLSKNPSINVHYPALKNMLAQYEEGDITPELIHQVVCDIRRTKLPDPAVLPNVGSFFKNPVVQLAQLRSIQTDHPDVVFFPYAEGFVKLAAAWLIDRGGWKGFSADAAVHSQQALVLTNPNKLKAHVVLALAEKIQSSIFDQFGVRLELEPRVYP